MEKIVFNKWQNKERDFDFTGGVILSRDNQKLEISFLGNGDLYFNLLDYENNNVFYIGKDNYEIYNCFDVLYSNITDGNIFKDESFDKEYYKRKAIDRGLIDNNRIIWKSDDFSHEVAPYFSIEKLDNSFKLTFDKPKSKLDGYEDYLLSSVNCNIRIRNSGSFYDPFNIAFMDLFNSLLNIDDKVHQIHFEEYLIDKELENGKTLKKIFEK